MYTVYTLYCQIDNNVYLYNNSNIVKSKNNTKIPKYSKPLSENRI